MKIKEITITTFDFSKIRTPQDLLQALETLGFRRYAVKQYLDPKRRIDKRYPAEQDESPPGYYTTITVPHYHFDNDFTLFIINSSILDKIKKSLTEGVKQ